MLFNDYKAYREAWYPVWKQRRLLKGSEPELYSTRKEEFIHKILRVMYFTAVIACILLMLRGCDSPAWASDTIDTKKLATAIYKAEGIHSKHPYGILAHYKHTTARQACLNTIRHRLRLWNGSGSFIIFLSRTYCPIGSLNDPEGLNKNWVKNVSYFYYGRG
jgi:hypothetical protein